MALYPNEPLGACFTSGLPRKLRNPCTGVAGATQHSCSRKGLMSQCRMIMPRKTKHLSFALIVMGILSLAIERRVVAESDAAESSAEKPTPVVVVRFSAVFFEQLFSRQIDRQVHEQMQVLDAWCTGVANATGQSAIDFSDAKLDEPLTIKITGNMLADSQGSVGPFVSQGITSIDFVVHCELVFDGTKFQLISCRADAYPNTRITSVAMCRNRIGNRVVSRLAERVAPSVIGKYDVAARPQIEFKIAQTVSDGMEEILEHVNKSVKIDSTLVGILKAGNFERVVSKHPDHLQARFAKATSTEQPPLDESALESLVEVWVYPSLASPALREVSRRWKTLPADLAKVLPPQIKPFQDFEEGLRVESVGEWDVIRVGVVSTDGESANK